VTRIIRINPNTGTRGSVQLRVDGRLPTVQGELLVVTPGESGEVGTTARRSRTRIGRQFCASPKRPAVDGS
jgi:hypothetical protein